MTSPHSKKIAILQSNYIPWKGYMDIIGFCDEFVIFDDAQFTRRDWRNRNMIKTPHGCEWLTIPVETKGKFTQLIKDTRTQDSAWAAKHWSSIRHNYSKAKHFDWCAEWLEPLYSQAAGQSFLSDVNALFLRGLCGALGITTKLGNC